MTVSEAKNILTFGGFKVTKVRENAYQVEVKDTEAEVLSKEELIEIAKKINQNSTLFQL